jgi:hypothetical protein
MTCKKEKTAVAVVNAFNTAIVVAMNVFVEV